MIPVLYPSTETEFTTNGLGRLTDCISFSVTEERNGVYEVEFVYPVTGIHYNDIEIGCIVYATHDALKEPEPFDIYKKSAPIEGRVTFYAHHVSYRLNEVVVRPFSMLGTAGEALNALKTNAVNTCGFTFFSDKATRLTYTVKQPDTLRHLLGGVQGSILDVYGSGDYEFKKFAVRLVTRGADRGVSIRYGKNMSDIKAVSNAEGTYNGVVPYWAQEDEIVTLPEWYITRSGVTDPILAPLDLTEEWTTAPTVEQLRAKATERLNNTTPWVLDENIEVEFEPLEQTEDYADVAELQRVCIGDTVGIYYKAIGVSTKARVIKTVYSPLLEEYISVQVGDPQTTLADTIAERTENALAKKVVSPGYVAAAVNAATEKITGGLGGYVVIGKSANGTPEEILIMDTDDVQTAVNVIRMNRAGIGFSNTGYQGPFTSAWTIDGVFNTDYIVVNSLSVLSQNAGTITAGVLQSSDYQYTVGARYTTAGMIVDLDNKVIRTPRTAILADGSIYSTSVDLEGKINATSGSIGPWQISSTAIYNGLQSATGNDSGIYIGTNGIFGLSTDKTFRWYFNLGGNFYLEDLGTGTATTAILRMKKGTLQSRILPWGFNTYVDNESKSRIYLSSQNGTQRLELSNGTYTDVDICTTSTASYLYVGSPSDTGHGNVQLDAGSTYASVYICDQNRSSSVEINTSSPHIKIKSSTGTTSGWGSYNPQIVFQNANATKNGALIWNDTVQSPASLTLAGNQGGEYFIAPNIKATGAFYGSLTGHASLDLPLTGGTLSGSVTISTTGAGLLLTDSTSTAYGGIYDAGDNLWIGARWSNEPHHRGASGNTYISAGYSTSRAAGNSTIYISVPSLSGTTWSQTAYGVLHTGNYSSYALPLSGGTLTGNITIGQTTDTVIRGVTSRNSLGNVGLTVGSDGSHGLYSGTKGGFLLYATKDANSTNSTLYIPRPLTVSGLASVGNNVIATASDTSERYFRAVNSKGSIELNASAGNKGIYDRSGSRWIMYLDTNSTGDTPVRIPRALHIGTADLNGYIELYHATPYIDFHFGRSTEDYTYRIMESSSGVLWFSGSQSVAGNITISTTSTTVERAVTVSTGNVSGAVRANNGGTGGAFGLYVTKTGGTARTGTWLSAMDSGGTYHANWTSDEREKKVFGLMDSREAETLLRSVDIINFSYKSDQNQIVQNGMIAQQMRDVLTENGIGYRSYLNIISVKDDDFLYDVNTPESEVRYGIDYARLTPILWKGWQLHDDRITALEKENEALKAEIKALKGAA